MRLGVDVDRHGDCRASSAGFHDHVARGSRLSLRVDPGGRRNAHTLDAPARDLVEVPTSAATAAVRCPRVRADRSPADRAAVPPAAAPLRRKRAVAHDVEAQLSTVVTPALGAGHPVDRVHRASVPGGNPRFSPKISEVKTTDQQRPAQAPPQDPTGPPFRDAQVVSDMVHGLASSGGLRTFPRPPPSRSGYPAPDRPPAASAARSLARGSSAASPGRAAGPRIPCATGSTSTRSHRAACRLAARAAHGSTPPRPAAAS